MSARPCVKHLQIIRGSLCLPLFKDGQLAYLAHAKTTLNSKGDVKAKGRVLQNDIGRRFLLVDR